MGYVNLLDIIYPVDSIYFSMDSTSPSEIMGGVWVQIVDKCVRGSDNVNIIGDDKHTLSINEMPVHAHAQYVTANPNTGTCPRTDYIGDGGYSRYYQCDTGFNGGDKPHNNLPAAQNMYIWYRVS